LFSRLLFKKVKTKIHRTTSVLTVLSLTLGENAMREFDNRVLRKKKVTAGWGTWHSDEPQR
jgi:hypothetical protein